MLQPPISSARTSRLVAVLTSAPFLTALGLLLLNDWVLKGAFGNWLTGKLSDVAGPAAVTMLGAAIFSRHVRAVFVLTVVAFVFWKSPLSDGVLATWNALDLLPLVRVKDYSDLLALAVLVPAYRFVHHRSAPRCSHRGSFARHLGAATAGVVGLVAITATSVLRVTPIETIAYPVTGGRAEVLAALDSIGAPISRRSKAQPSSSADTLTIQFRHPPERWVTVTVEISETRPGEAEIRPVALWPHGPPPSSMDLLMRAFTAQVVKPLEEWLTRRRAEGR
jgi:hypothetical protein